MYDENKSVRDLFGQLFFSFFNHVRVFVSFRPLERSRPSHVDEIARIHLTSMYLRVAGFAHRTKEL